MVLQCLALFVEESLLFNCLHLSVRLKHIEGDLKKKQDNLKSTEKEYEKDSAVSDKLQKEKKKIEVS